MGCITRWRRGPDTLSSSGGTALAYANPMPVLCCVQGVCPNMFSMLVDTREGRWREAKWLWVASSRTLRVSHTMGLPSYFLCPQLLCPPKIHGHRCRMAYIPHWRGEAKWQRVWVWANGAAREQRRRGWWLKIMINNVWGCWSIIRSLPSPSKLACFKLVCLIEDNLKF